MRSLTWPEACRVGASFEASPSGRQNGAGGRGVMGRQQQCAASLRKPHRCSYCVRVCSRDRGAQLAASAVSTTLNVVDSEPPRRIRPPAVVK